MDESKCRILIVDDHPAVREGLALIFGAEPSFEIAGVAGTCRQALELIRSERPTVALIDINLPDGSGFDLTRLIKLHSPLCRVLLYSAQNAATCSGWAMQCGADGYLDKSSEPPRIRDALMRVWRGELVFEAAALAEQLKSLRDDAEGIRNLSAREFEVFFQLGWGHNTKEIAALLDISPRTAETHHRNIRKKLGVPHHDALVRLATIVFATDARGVTGVRRDMDLLARFEAAALAADEWNHRLHLRVAFIYLARQPFGIALRRVCAGMRTLNTGYGNPPSYHETVATAWMRILAARLDSQPVWLHSQAFLEAHADLVSADPLELVLRHYSPELLETRQAHASFVEPDRKPLPNRA